MCDEKCEGCFPPKCKCATYVEATSPPPDTESPSELGALRDKVDRLEAKIDKLLAARKAADWS